MNIERIVTMVSRRLLRKLVNRSVGTGVDYAARRGKETAQMSPEEKQQARAARQAAKKARQSAKLLRRMGRF